MSILSLGAPAAATVTLSDGERVFCMVEARKQQMVETAVSLSLVTQGPAPGALQQGGSTFVSLDDWATEQPDQFARACRALITSISLTQGSSSTSGSASSSQAMVQPQLFNTLASTALGALLTLTTTYLWRSRDRSKRESEVLRDALGAFSGSVRDYLTQRSAPTVTSTPPVEALERAKLNLMRHLGRFQSRGAGKFPVTELIAVLNSSKFGSELTSGWNAGDHAARQHRSRTLGIALTKFETDVDLLTETVLQPAPIRLLRRRPKILSAGEPELKGVQE